MTSSRAGEPIVAILAAGASRRFGVAKQEVVIEGAPLIVHVIRNVLEHVCDEPIVIVAAGSNLPGLLADERVEVVTNDRAGDGMGTSIATAARRAREMEAAALVVVLGDQLEFHGSTFAELLALSSSEKIVATRYPDGFIAPPVSFGSRFFDELAELEGEEGARGIIASHSSAVTLIDSPTPFVDIDTPEALRSIEASRQNHEGQRRSE